MMSDIPNHTDDFKWFSTHCHNQAVSNWFLIWKHPLRGSGWLIARQRGCALTRRKAKNALRNIALS